MHQTGTASFPVLEFFASPFLFPFPSLLFQSALDLSSTAWHSVPGRSGGNGPGGGAGRIRFGCSHGFRQLLDRKHWVSGSDCIFPINYFPLIFLRFYHTTRSVDREKLNCA
jgi:hypothetical protein